MEKIQVRRGASSDWTSTNPIPSGGLETDTRKLKIGDGSTAWNNLKYVNFDGDNLDSPLAPPPQPTPSNSFSSSDSCPAPWMKILLADGTSVPAGELKKGIMVHTRAESNFKWGDYEVVAMDIVMSERMKISVGNVEFTCSPTHKFWDGYGWITAEQLRIGGLVDGLKISSIEDVDYGEVVKITVDGAHTYVCEGILSHNKNVTTMLP